MPHKEESRGMRHFKRDDDLMRFAQTAESASLSFQRALIKPSLIHFSLFCNGARSARLQSRARGARSRICWCAEERIEFSISTNLQPETNQAHCDRMSDFVARVGANQPLKVFGQSDVL